MPMRNRHGESQESDTTASNGTTKSHVWKAAGRARRASARAFARLPRPVRLLWIFLAILGTYATVVNLGGIGLAPLLTLPGIAVLTDTLFQRFRFKSIRVPDAALATGLFLALLLPPTVNLVQAAAITVAAIALRHVLRYRERPFLNPAAIGIVLGALLFGMAPAWWGSIEVRLVVVLGVLLTLRTPGSWRLPASFLIAHALLSPISNTLLGEATSSQVLILQTLNPSVLFFGLFMVAEPRTSLSRPMEMWFFGLYVAAATVFLPALIPTLAPLVALLLGNVMAVTVRQIRTTSAHGSKAAKKKASRRDRRKQLRKLHVGASSLAAGSDWQIGRRIVAGVVAFALVGVAALASNGLGQTPIPGLPPGIPSPPPSGTSTRDCTKDNPNVPADALSFLHGRLGPSVVLSYDSNAGTTVFYDPVNKATVTETDIYEDFGYAEFNGDDYAVLGCHP